MAVAAIHTLVAVIIFAEPLAGILTRGVYDAVGKDPITGVAVWFALFGFMLFITGLAIDHLERSSPRPLPLSLGVSVLTLSSLGIALMPASGFWLALPPGIAMMVRRK